MEITSGTGARHLEPLIKDPHFKEAHKNVYEARKYEIVKIKLIY